MAVLGRDLGTTFWAEIMSKEPGVRAATETDRRALNLERETS